MAYQRPTQVTGLLVLLVHSAGCVRVGFGTSANAKRQADAANLDAANLDDGDVDAGAAVDAGADARYDRGADAATSDLSGADATTCQPIGSGACDGGFCGSCSSVYSGSGVRAWPVQTNAAAVCPPNDDCCRDGTSVDWPSVGSGSADWFGYGSCGTYKDFPAGSGCQLRIFGRTDDQVLDHVVYNIYDWVGGKWHAGPSVQAPRGENSERVYFPIGSQVRIEWDSGSAAPGSAGFYVCVFQE